jgi:hypothetical protein
MKVFDKGASYKKGSKKSAVMQDGPHTGGKAKISKRDMPKANKMMITKGNQKDAIQDMIDKAING